MKIVFCIFLFAVLLCSPASAQEEVYKEWSSWHLLDKSHFLAGANSQVHKLCAIIARYQQRTRPGRTYDSLFYECMTIRITPDPVEIIKEMDRLYQNPENRKKPIGGLYGDAFFTVLKKGKK